MEIFIIIFSFIFSLLGLWREIHHILKHKTLTVSSLVGIVFVSTYGILPLVVMWIHRFSDISISSNHFQYDYSDTGLTQTLVWQTFGIIAYLIIAYITRNVNRAAVQNTAENATPADCSLLQTVTFFTLIIGVFSLYLWSRAFGGIGSLIKVASMVRSGLSTVNNRFAFFKHPARMVIITSFSSLLLAKKRYLRPLNIILFVVSFYYAILFLLANDGRMSFIMYFAIILFIAFDFFSEKTFTAKRLVLLCLLACIGIIFIMKLDAITYYIRYKIQLPDSADPFLISVVKEFAYVMVSGQEAMKHASKLDFFIIDDILNGIQAWLPTSLKLFNVRNVWNYNTSVATYNFVAQFPCDFISTSLYDLSYAGPVVFGLFWGTVLKKVENLKTINTMFSAVCYYALSTSLFRLVDYCMLYDFILGIFSVTVFAVIHFILKSIFTRKNN